MNPRRGVNGVGESELAAMAQRLDHGYNQLDKLYYEVARACGLPECPYWMLYDIVQHGGSRPIAALCAEWGYGKQTINSALKLLSMRGIVDLVYAEGSRKHKVAQLTEQGRRFSERFIAPALDAEVKALSTLTELERKRFEALMNKYDAALTAELTRLKVAILEETR